MEKWLIVAMFTQVFLTFAVMYIMGKRRFRAAKQKTIEMKDFLTMELEKAGDNVRVADRNFINQFEMPMLFFYCLFNSSASQCCRYCICCPCLGLCCIKNYS